MDVLPSTTLSFDRSVLDTVWMFVADALALVAKIGRHFAFPFPVTDETNAPRSPSQRLESKNFLMTVQYFLVT